MVERVTKFGAAKERALFVVRAAINLHPPPPASVATLDASLLDKACS